MKMKPFKGETVFLQLRAPVVVCGRGPVGPIPGMVPSRQPTQDDPSPPPTLAQMPFVQDAKVQDINEDDTECTVRYPLIDGKGEGILTIPCDLILCVTRLSNISLLAH